jgi:flagellar protein FliS
LKAFRIRKIPDCRAFRDATDEKSGDELLGYGEPEYYQAYSKESILNSDPLELIVLLYEAAVEATIEAEACFRSGDIFGRGRQLTKAVNIIDELLRSVRDEPGTNIGQNLKNLYSYIRKRLLYAHAQQDMKALGEVRGLLNTLLDGWRTLHRTQHAPAPATNDFSRETERGLAHDSQHAYQHYLAPEEGSTVFATF